MSGTLNDALESATDGLTTEEDLEVSTESESEEDQTEEVESTEEETDEESQNEDKSTDESKKTEESKTEESKEDKQESFTKIDPNSLPEEVKPVYKSLLADYTRKRQQEAEVVKTVQAENEQLKEQLGKVQQGGRNGQVQPGQVKIDLTPEQIGEMTLPEYTQYVINKALEANQASEATREVQTFEQEAVTGFLSIDARLNPELETSYDPKLAMYVGNNVDKDYEAHIKAKGTPIGFDYKASAEKHIGEWDSWVKGIKKESVKQTTQASKQQAQRLQKSAPPTTQAKSKPSSKMDINGAIDAAFDAVTE